MDREAWQATVQGSRKSRTQLSDETTTTVFVFIAQLVNNLQAMQETWVQFLGKEDPLEKEMATYSSSLAWEIPWTEEPGWLQPIGSQRVGHDLATKQQITIM